MNIYDVSDTMWAWSRLWFKELFDAGGCQTIPESNSYEASENVNILLWCRYVPVPGLYWADAASIGTVQARYWQRMACLQSIYKDQILVLSCDASAGIAGTFQFCFLENYWSLGHGYEEWSGSKPLHCFCTAFKALFVLYILFCCH